MIHALLCTCVAVLYWPQPAIVLYAHAIFFPKSYALHLMPQPIGVFVCRQTRCISNHMHQHQPCMHPRSWEARSRCGFIFLFCSISILLVVLYGLLRARLCGAFFRKEQLFMYLFLLGIWRLFCVLCIFWPECTILMMLDCCGLFIIWCMRAAQLYVLVLCVLVLICLCLFGLS
jgi:hypothetical protein